MAAQPKSVASAYARVNVESEAMGANPQQLIEMLFDAVHAALRKANREIENGDRAAKSQSLNRAIQLIASGLRASLDGERGGDLAEDLDSLYDFMIRELMRANLHNDPERINKVDSLLGDISSAWKQMGQ